MALQLNDRQVALLKDPAQLEQLARWIIAATSNTNNYARLLRDTLSVPQGVKPTQAHVRTVMRYLASERADSGVVARLINAYLQSFPPR